MTHKKLRDAGILADEQVAEFVGWGTCIENFEGTAKHLLKMPEHGRPHIAK